MSAFHDNALIGASGQQGYKISRSVRLRSSASAYLNRTLTTPTNNKIWTYSFWYKRGTMNDGGAAGGTKSPLFDAPSSANTFDTIYIRNADNIIWYEAAGGATICYLESTPVFRDPSAWYHLVIVYDSAQATAANRQKIYVNNVQITAFSTAIYVAQNTNGRINSAVAHKIGSSDAAGTYLDGYITEANFIDGQALTPSSFGETNAITGVWQPKKYAGTYGTNGFYLNFSDNSNNTAATIGKDNSGNGNNWTPNNISVTAGVTYDSMIDVPTLYADGGNGRGNYCVLNPLDKNTNIALSEGNLTAIPSSTADYWLARATMAFPTTGKWYWELTLNNTPYLYQAGIYSSNRPNSGSISATGNEYQVAWGTAFTYIQFQSNNAAFAAWGTNTNPTSGNVLMFAYDADNATMWIGRNGTWYNTSGTANPATNTDPRFSSIPSGLFAGVNLPNPASGGVSMNFGQRPFSYTPPTGFVALNTQNLPTPTISNGASYMAATIYTGTGSALTIANTVGSASFQPDLVWVKGRSGATDHAWYDAVRGVQNQLESNTTTAETAETTGLTAFGSTGFTIGALAQMNTNTATYVAWQWNGGGSTVTNTSGSISAQVRANATAGFSVVTYTGTGSAATIGHGLGVAPRMIIIFERSPGGDDHIVYHASLTSNSYSIRLNTTAAQAGPSGAYWNSTSPTSSVFSVGTSGESNQSTATYVAYCFAAVAGYSAFGSYTGNSSADGPFVFLGFRPKYVLIKSSVVAGGTWVVFDSARSTYNVTGEKLAPNAADSENSGATGIAGGVDFLSNGFKIRLSWGDINTSNTLIYAAFAENPFKNSLAR